VKTTFELKGFKVILNRYWNCYVHEHRYFFILKGPGHKHTSQDFCSALQANEAALQFAEELEGDYLKKLRQELSRTLRLEPLAGGSARNGNSATLH